MSLGTRLFTWAYGQFVGMDDQGNRYYTEKRSKSRPASRPQPRRWVMYNGTVEASRIPPEWHRWLHGTSDHAPTEVPLEAQPWEQAHQQNQTGTPDAYLPDGHLNGHLQPPHHGHPHVETKVRTGYQAWRPE